jgi:hypothetical protein
MISISGEIPRQHDRDAINSIEDALTFAFASNDLKCAAKHADRLAALRWGSQWYPRQSSGSRYHRPIEAPGILTVPKLRHDSEQFKYLQHRAILGKEFSQIVRKYEALAEEIASQGVTKVPYDSKRHRSIKHVYNRIVHVRETPRVRKALSAEWDSESVESQYHQHQPGLVIIDNFLSHEALNSLRLFCLESTVWSSTRHSHGRLGSFFWDGFNCPLLIQIAEELRERLPHLLGNQYPLQQLWGFKCEPELPEDATNHADFAAVNVNFWLTPDEANLDPSSGGLVVYDVEAPLSWDFYTYNGKDSVIKPFLLQQKAGRTVIPYRQNRAIIFNSDLFHATDGVRFHPAYENRRLNVTLLYGDRCDDTQHRTLPDQTTPHSGTARSSAWRSMAISRFRR